MNYKKGILWLTLSNIVLNKVLQIRIFWPTFFGTLRMSYE